MAKRFLEAILTLIIIVGITILAFEARNEKVAMDAYTMALAVNPGEINPHWEEAAEQVPDLYSEADKTRDPAALQGMAQKEAERIIATGDVSRLHSEIAKTGIVREEK